MGSIHCMQRFAGPRPLAPRPCLAISYLEVTIKRHAPALCADAEESAPGPVSDEAAVAVRDAMEKALTACGSDLSSGDQIWDM